MAVDPFFQETGDELVVATPELVTFDYQLAGPGSRFLAQLIDFPIQLLLLLLAGLAGVGLARVVPNTSLVIVATLMVAFIVVWGYYAISEAAWSGKTLGKLAFGLRVVGDHGEPITIGQSVVRNLVRIVDFLPFFYGLGIIALFANGRGKRLGDLAAGTVVVRERAPITLKRLRAAAEATTADGSPGNGPGVDPPLLRQLDPELKRFVVAYASRRPGLESWRRQLLAERVEPGLRRALPEVVASQGPVAALDHLANLASETAGAEPEKT